MGGKKCGKTLLNEKAKNRKFREKKSLDKKK